jgi:hypothetical protein
MDKRIELLFTRTNELMKQMTAVNNQLDIVVSKLNNLQIQTTQHNVRIEKIDRFIKPDESMEPIVVKKSQESSDISQSSTTLKRIDVIEKELERMKSIVTSFILQNPESESNEDDLEDSNKPEQNELDVQD